ncbi:MAG: HAD family phosphatase [Actinomycetales bacterium]|nr:HAD family phosphatase [Actinomycetales bacterium]
MTEITSSSGGESAEPAAPVAATSSAPLSPPGPSGLLVDWGGVLTGPMDEAMRSWTARDGVRLDHFHDVMSCWAGLFQESGPTVTGSPVHALERGELDRTEFEVLLAEALAGRGSPVPAEGLLDRLLGGLAGLAENMAGLVRRARAAGIRTALLSNSWGDHYPEQLWDGLFDAVVISGRVGMRKPEPEIFRHTAELLGLEPADCVMVDDLPHNIHGAVATGMIGVHFRTYDQTAEELEAIFDIPLR